MKIRFVNSKIIDILIALGGVLAVSFVLTSFWDFYYDINDDMMIKDIVSGRYTGTPDGHNIQMLYPIGLIISFFYRIAPQFPWYAYFLCLLMALCFFLIWKRLVSVTHKFWKKILFLLEQKMQYLQEFSPLNLVMLAAQKVLMTLPILQINQDLALLRIEKM